MKATLLLLTEFLYLILPKTDAKHIFVKYEKGYQFCLLSSSCDGSEDNPSGSLLEALSLCFSIVENCNILLYDREYVVKEEESKGFLNIANQSSLIFSHDFQTVKRLNILGAANANSPWANSKTKMVFEIPTFSIMLRNSILSIENVEITIPSANNFIFHAPASGDNSELYFINVTMNLIEAKTVYSTNSSLILSSKPAALNIKLVNFVLNCSAEIKFYFILAEGESYENKFANFSIINSSFFAQGQGTLCQSKILQSFVEIANTRFYSSEYFNFLFKGVVMTIKDSEIFFSHNVQNFKLTKSTFISVVESSLNFLNSSVLGDWSLDTELTGVIDLVFFEAVSNSTINCQDLILKNLSVKAIFSLGLLNKYKGLNLMFKYLGNTVMLANDSNELYISNLTFKNGYKFVNNRFFLEGLFIIALEKNLIKIGFADFRENEIYLGGLIILSESNMSIEKSYFKSNQGHLNGSLLIVGASESLRISSCIFEGSVFSERGSNAKILGSNFVYLENNSFLSSFAREGGSIYIEDCSHVSIFKGIFQEAIAGERGGALYLSNVLEVILVNLTLINTKSLLSAGGAVHLTDSQIVIIVDSLFRLTAAAMDGGAVYSTNTTLIYLRNNSFEHSFSKLEGGSLCFYSTQSIFTLNCSFKNSTSSYSEGGCMFVKSARIFVSLNLLAALSNSGKSGGVISVLEFEVFFISNHSYEDAKSSYNGGSINLINGGNIVITSVLTNRTSAIGRGGAINVNNIGNCAVNELKSLFSNSIDKGGSLYIYDCQFFSSSNSQIHNSNSSVKFNSAGGVFYINKVQIILLQRPLFNRSTSEGYGGSVLIETANSVYIVNSSSLITRAYIHGGTFCLNNITSVRIENSSFATSSADGGGGSIVVNTAKIFLIRNIISSSSYALQNGGFMFVQLVTNVVIEYIDIRNSQAQVGGSILVTTGETMYLRNVFSLNSVSLLSGGFHYVYNVKVLAFENQDLRTSKADGNGGSIYVSTGNSILIWNISCLNSTTNQNGGFIYIYLFKNISIEGTKITNSKSTGSGGSIYILGAGDTLMVRDIILLTSTSFINGGFIYVASIKNVTFENQDLRNTKADGSGGAIYVGWGESLYIRNISSTVSKAIGSGGTINVYSCSSLHMNNTNSTLSESTSMGGFLSIYYVKSISIEIQIIRSSKADVNGGSIYLIYGGTLSFRNMNIFNTTCYQRGAALYIESTPKVIIEYLEVIKSSSVNDGGGLFIYASSYLLMRNFSSTNSSSQMNGGSFYAQQVYNVEMTNVVCKNPRSEKFGGSMSLLSIQTFKANNFLIDSSSAYMFGGLIYLAICKEALFVNSSFDKSKSEYGGGGVFFISNVTQLTASNLRASNSYAYTSGGAFSIFYSQYIVVRDCLFQGSISYSSGGVIHLLGSSKILISSCYFWNSFAISDGGSLDLQYVNNLTFSKSLIVNSKAMREGGSINAMNSSDVQVILIYLQNSSSDVSGGSMSFNYGERIRVSDIFAITSKTIIYGGLLFIDQSNYFNLSSILLKYSSAELGSFLNIKNSNTVILSGLNFSSGTTSIGGMSFSDCDTFSVSKTVMQNNYARRGGAEINVERGSKDGCFSNILIINSLNGFEGSLILRDYIQRVAFSNLLIKNTSADRGGCILVSEGSLNLSFKFILFDLSSSLDGGVIYIGYNNSNISMDNLLVYSATARRGAFSYIHSQNNVSIKKVRVLKAIATNLGGLTFSTMGNQIIFENINIVFMGSEFDGGVVYLTSQTNLTLKFLELKAAYSLTGGAFFVREDSNLSMEASSIGDIISEKIDSEIFRLSEEKPSITIFNSSILNLKDYLVNQFGDFSLVIFKNCSIYFSLKYSKSGFLIISSKMADFKFIKNVIFLNRLPLEYFVKIDSPGVSILFSALMTKFNKIGVFLVCGLLDFRAIKITGLDMSVYYGTLIRTEKIAEKKTYPAPLIVIENSKLMVNNNIFPFIYLKGLSDLVISGIDFIVSRNQYLSVILSESFGLDLYKFFILRLNSSQFIVFEGKSSEQPKESSDYPLIWSEKSFSHIELQRVTVFLHRINMSAILVFKGGNRLFMQTCNLIGNYLNDKSHFFLLKISLNFHFEMRDSKIIRNKVVYGAIISLELDLISNTPSSNYSLKIVFQNNTLKYNTANQGGFIYFNSSFVPLETKSTAKYNKIFKTINFTSNVIYKTTAMIGSLLFWEGSIVNSFEDKEFSIIPDSFSYQKYNAFTSIEKIVVAPLSQLNYDYKLLIELPEKIYQNKEEPEKFYFCLGLYDRNKKLLFANSASLLKASMKSTEPLVKMMSFHSDQIRVHFIFHKGLYCANRFEFRYKYYQLHGLKLVISLEPLVKLNDSETVFKYLSKKLNRPTQILFEVDQCKEGEYFENSTQSCSTCSRNSYSERKNLFSQADCKSCKETDTFNCYGSNFKSPKKDYWRLNFDSSRFLKCPTSKCLGDVYFMQNFTNRDCINCFLPMTEKKSLYLAFDKETTAVGLCAPGYQGSLCTDCRKGFGFESGFKCGDCRSINYYLRQFLMLFIKLCLFLFVNIKSIKNKFSTRDFGSVEFVSNFKKGYLMKVIMTHFNYLSFLSNLKFGFGDLANDLFSYTVDISPTEDFKVFSFECLMIELGLDSTPFIYSKMLISISFLSLALLLMMCLAAIVTPLKQISFVKKVKSVARGVFLVFITDNIILLVNTLISAVICINVGDDSKPDFRILQQPEISCYDSKYKVFAYYIALPLMVILLLIIPLYILMKLLLLRQQKVIMNQKFFRDFNYFIFAFRRKYNFFEIFLLATKCGLVILKQYFLELIILDNEVTGVLIFLLYTIMLYSILSIFKPYKRNKYGSIQKCEILSLLTNVSNGLLAIFWLLTLNNNSSSSIQVIIIIYFLLSNGFFFTKWLVMYFSVNQSLNFSNFKRTLSLKFSENFKLLKSQYDKLLQRLQIKKKETAKTKSVKNIDRYNDYISVKRKDYENIQALNKLLIKRIKTLEKNPIKSQELVSKGTESPFADARLDGISIKPKIVEEISIISEHSLEFEPDLEIKVNASNPNKASRHNRSKAKQKTANLLESKISKGTFQMTSEMALISKELSGSSYYDQFIVLRFTLPLYVYNYEESELLHLKTNDPDWSVTSFKEQDSDTLVVALKKNSKWIGEPFTRTLHLRTKNKLKYRGARAGFLVELKLSDYIYIRELVVSDSEFSESTDFEEFSECKFSFLYVDLTQAVNYPEGTNYCYIKVNFTLAVNDKHQKEAIFKVDKTNKAFYSCKLPRNQITYLALRVDEFIMSHFKISQHLK